MPEGAACGAAGLGWGQMGAVAKTGVFAGPCSNLAIKIDRCARAGPACRMGAVCLIRTAGPICPAGAAGPGCVPVRPVGKLAGQAGQGGRAPRRVGARLGGRGGAAAHALPVLRARCAPCAPGCAALAGMVFRPRLSGARWPPAGRRAPGRPQPAALRLPPCTPMALVCRRLRLPSVALLGPCRAACSMRRACVAAPHRTPGKAGAMRRRKAASTCAALAAWGAAAPTHKAQAAGHGG